MLEMALLKARKALLTTLKRDYPSVVDDLRLVVGTDKDGQDALFVTVILKDKARGDYDPLRRFNRADTIIEVGRAERLVKDWGLVPDGDEKRFFLCVIGTAGSQRSEE